MPARWFARRSRAALQREPPVRAAGGTKGSGPTYEVRAAEGMGMTPGEIRACYRLYAAHRKSHEICVFPGTIPAVSNARNSDDLAVLLRLQTGLEELVRDIGHRDPNDDLRPALVRPLGHLQKMLASFAMFGRGALVGR